MMRNRVSASDENGYIVVETVGAFMLFTFLLVSILTLINIVTVQQRVHYALTQTANELSMYCYVIEAMGFTDTVKSTAGAREEMQEKIDGVVSDVGNIQSGLSGAADDSFLGNMQIVIDSIESLAGTAEGVMENPQDTLYNLILYGFNGTKDFLMQEYVIKPIVMKHLKTGDVSGETFLDSYKVISKSGSYLDLGDSSFIDSNGDITIVANYSIDYTFGALPLPFAELNITQTAKTKAWLDGDDYYANDE